MSRTMRFASRVAAGLVAVLHGPALHAQAAPQDSSAWSRVSVAVRYGVLTPSGNSEVYSLIDRALDPGASRLSPRLTGIDLSVRITPRWSIRLGAESGERTMGSVSRVSPATTTSAVAQQTALQVASAQSLGVEWRAARWTRSGGAGLDRARVILGAGVGTARYRFHQWGAFVDAERLVAYRDDFYSTGRGTFEYLSAGLDVPIRRWVALQGTVHQQFGSAPMSDDFATFDHIDLGGTNVSVGVRFSPAGLFGRR
ncbi:hypothetical protein [Gemmatimonas sp.]|uniref:hypothetical protein n=1 Tax=Gemmatimonas sp. TaxID=1962908 RepID=UPI00286A06A8|nr:hypothetical protein [Gemmatimonas sp.]